MRTFRMTMLVLTVAALGVSSAFAQSSTPNPNAWVTDGTVRAIVQSGDTTYIGGDFTYVGPNTGSGVPLDAATGSPVATYPKVNGTVYASVSDGSGGWYIGGYFTLLGNMSRNNIAHIRANGSVDLTWNPGADGTVRALAVSGTTVYAGGDFGTIGGAFRGYIAALDASGVATAWNPNANSGVLALAVSGTTVYAGGYFTTIGGVTRNRIAAINASGVATAWNPDANNRVNALAVSGTTVYAGGFFTTIGGVTRNRIAAINASGVATTWNPNATTFTGTNVYALAVSGTTVYAGGGFTTIGGQPRKRIVALDATTGLATTWNPCANNYVYSLAVSGTTVYAGGGFTTIGGQTRNRIAALDASGVATAWNPNANNVIYSLAVSGTTVYAGGNFTTIGGQTRNCIAALDASGVATAWNPSANNSVVALAVSGTTVYAGGWFTTIGGQSRNRTAALDASTNTNNATAWNPDANSSVVALAVSGTTVYAGGDFTTIGGATRNRIAALDASGVATSWNPNPNANSYVSALAVSGTTVYAGGSFTTIGGATRNRIAALDASGVATAWDPNASDQVNALAVSGMTVRVGGAFTSIGGATRNYIAALDASGVATNWNPNASSFVYALAVSGTTLHVGGNFTTIGGNPQGYYAQFDLPPAAPTSPGADPITTDSIRWTWSDQSSNETGFKVWAFPGSEAPTTLQTTTLAGVQSWQHNSLNVNSQYAFQVAATNANGDSAKTDIFTAWTLAALPTAPVVSGATVDTLNVAVGSSDGNPAATTYAIQISPDVSGNSWLQADGSVGGVAVYRTAADWGTTTVASLADYTNYSFSATAQNGAGVLTSAGPAGTGRTLDGTPPVTPFTTLGADPSGWTSAATVDVSFSTTDAGSGGVTYTLAVDGGDYAPVTSSYPLDVSGLAHGQHVVHVKAKDAALNETAPQDVNIYLDYAIVASSGGHGGISPNGTVRVAGGANQLFTFTPDEGYRVLAVSVGGVPVSPVPQTSHEITNVTADTTIAVTFAENTYALTVVGGTGGGTYVYGTSHQIVATPPEEHTHFWMWTKTEDSASIITEPSSASTSVTVNDAVTVTANYKLDLVANAGPDQVADIRVPAVAVALDGAGTDPNTGTLEYSWSFESKPSGSSLTVLVNPTSQTPTFTPDVCGDYVVQLEVTSEYGSATDTVLVQAKRDVTSVTNVQQDGKKSYLDRTTRKLVSTANITVSNGIEVAMEDVELRVVVTSTGSLEMLPLLAPPLAGWSYRPTTDIANYPTGGYFFKVLGDLAAMRVQPRDPADTVLDQLKFTYGTTVRFTYAVQVWGKY